MEEQRVLVTGGAGFIGANLANRLAERNEVIAIDDGSLGTPANLEPGVEFRDRSVLEDGLPTDVDAVFHLAALSSYGMHEDDPQQGARVNVEGFVNVVEQARADGCGAVVYASTSSIYGDRTSPTPEDASVEARTAYEASKLARERYAECFDAGNGTALAGLRLFSIYQGYGGAEAHKGGYANVIAQFADDLANGDAPKIYGDGTQTRDFLHVEDAVRGFELAAEHELSGVYNVGTGESHDFETVVALLNEELGTEIEPEHVPNPIPESAYVHDTCADHSRITEATGWRPRVDLEEGIERVCDPYRSGNGPR
ncbi:NAD-dependent epimerase/dehydratase family protein [Halalkalicoccus tibetensis]|uniref:NAD-dependent epimerase/dehydratase family protein n=1 Tax=Halalkalicoccus tibetensis TaxID=175632 RepID=A0ABD5V838_9EURY